MNRFLCTLCTLVSLALVACDTPPDLSPSPGRGDPYPAPLNDPQISVLSPDLRPWLGFQPALVTVDGQRPMQIELPVRNLTAHRYLVEYRMLFYDDRDRLLDPTMGWRMVPLDPKQTVRLEANALDTVAANWRAEVRWAQ